jgi:beta-glucosidase
VAQLYVNTPDAPAALQRPIKRLEGFQLVTLQPGETKTVSFRLPVANLAFFNQDDNRWEVDKGDYGIQLSTSAADADIQQQQLIKVDGELKPVPSVVTPKPTMPADALTDIHDRLMFPSNTQVLPNLTVDMSDDTLYGYVTKGASTAFPDGMKFSYSSDRPSVVAVDPDGTIHTTGTAGVATITATVSYRGVTRHGQFVVDNLGTSTVPY